jgi:hypothetical protein
MTTSRSIKKSTKERSPRVKRTKFDNGIWTFSEQLDFNNAHGFIYLIRDKENGMMYIGKKAYRGNGKKNRGQQSNWRTYTSSSKSLNEAIVAKGLSEFEFYVLEQYYTKGGWSWAETWSQCHVEVPSNNEVWMNRFIDKTMWRVTEHVTARHKSRLRKFWK